MLGSRLGRGRQCWWVGRKGVLAGAVITLGLLEGARSAGATGEAQSTSRDVVNAAPVAPGPVSSPASASPAAVTPPRVEGPPIPLVPVARPVPAPPAAVIP